MQDLTTKNDNDIVLQKSKENSTLSFFQGIACILVVLIHVPFPGAVGTFFESLARFAVPLFYMISGYTLYRYTETEKYRAKVASRIKKNALVTALAMLVYLLFDIAKCLLQNQSVSDYLVGLFTLKKLLMLLCIGIMPMNSGHILWFIYGLVYVYVIYWFFMPKKKNIYRNAVISLVVMILFFVGKIVCTVFKVSVFGIDLSMDLIYGNWVIIGWTSVTVGMALSKFIGEYPQKVNSIRRKSPYILFICIIMNFALCFTLNKIYGMYLSYTVFTLVLDCMIFIIATNDRFSTNNLMSVIGREHSRNVYLWHPMFFSITNYALEILGLQDTSLAAWGQPFAVILATLTFSFIMNFMFNLIKNKRSRGKQI